MEAAHNNGERLDYIVFSMDEILRGVTGTDLPSSLGNSNGNGVRRSRLDRAPTIWRTVLPFTLSFVNSPLPLVHSPLSSLSLMSPSSPFTAFVLCSQWSLVLYLRAISTDVVNARLIIVFALWRVWITESREKINSRREFSSNFSSPKKTVTFRALEFLNFYFRKTLYGIDTASRSVPALVKLPCH